MYRAENPESFSGALRDFLVIRRLRPRSFLFYLEILARCLLLYHVYRFICLVQDDSFSTTQSVLYLLMILILGYFSFLSFFLHLRTLRWNRAEGIEHVLYREDGIESAHLHDRCFFPYRVFQKIVEYKGTYYLISGDDLFYQKLSGLTEGSPEDFGAFLEERIGLSVFHVKRLEEVKR